MFHSLTLCDPMDCSMPGPLSFTIPRSLLKLMSIKSMMPSNHLILCHPLLLASIFPSIWVFSNESVLRIKWPNYWSFSISPSTEYSGVISFRVDWFDLLAVQVNLKSLLQHHDSKASILQRSAFFMVQLQLKRKKTHNATFDPAPSLLTHNHFISEGCSLLPSPQPRANPFLPSPPTRQSSLYSPGLSLLYLQGKFQSLDWLLPPWTPGSTCLWTNLQLGGSKQRQCL